MRLNKKTLEEQFIIDGIFNKKDFKKFKKTFDEFNILHNKKPRMKVSSAKAKGRGLQQRVRDIFRYMFKDKLEDGDIESRQMGGSGTDLVLSPLAMKHIPFDFECKNTESISIYSVIDQVKANTKKGRIPFIVFKKNGLEMWCSLPFDEFMKIQYGVDINIVKENNDIVDISLDEVTLQNYKEGRNTLDQLSLDDLKYIEQHII